MRILVITHLIFLFISCQQNAEKKEDPELLVLKGATLYDGIGNTFENSVIILEGDKIKTVGLGKTPIPENSKIIDLTGKFITPGMIDAHVHFFQTGFFDARPDALDLRDSLPYEEVVRFQKENPQRYYKTYLGSGVTGVYDVGGEPTTIALQKEAENDINAPHIAASGTLLTPVPDEIVSIFNIPGDTVMRYLDSEETGRKTVKYLSQLGSTGIKIWQLQTDNEDFMKSLEAVADEVQIQNNKLIVHATRLEQAKAALKLGAKVLVHSVDDKPVDQEFIDLIKRNNCVYTPTLIVSRGYSNTWKSFYSDPLVINDPNSLVDQKTLDLIRDTERYDALVDKEALKDRVENREPGLTRAEEVMAENLLTLYQNGVTIAVGTDAGNPGTLHGVSIFDELEAMEAAGIPSESLIKMATMNGSIAMSRDADIGTLAKGKIADLLVLDKDPGEDISNMRSITHVMRSGELIKVSDL